MTGYNRAFIIDNSTKEALVAKDPQSAEIIKPVLRGKDIKRYRAQWAGLWLIDIHNGYGTVPTIDINKYPAIKHHLDKFYSQIRTRQDQGITPYNLRSCTYHEEFMRDKIVYPNMTKYLPFLYDEKKFFTNQKCFIITGQHLRYLTGFLNTNIAALWIRRNCPELSGGTELSKIFFENIPIPLSREKDFPLKVDTLVKSISEEKFNQTSDIYKLESEISSIFYKLYDFNSKEIDFIENHLEYIR